MQGRMPHGAQLLDYHVNHAAPPSSPAPASLLPPYVPPPLRTAASTTQSLPAPSAPAAPVERPPLPKALVPPKPLPSKSYPSSLGQTSVHPAQSGALESANTRLMATNAALTAPPPAAAAPKLLEDPPPPPDCTSASPPTLRPTFDPSQPPSVANPPQPTWPDPYPATTPARFRSPFLSSYPSGHDSRYYLQMLMRDQIGLERMIAPGTEVNDLEAWTRAALGRLSPALAQLPSLLHDALLDGYLAQLSADPMQRSFGDLAGFVCVYVQRCAHASGLFPPDRFYAGQFPSFCGSITLSLQDPVLAVHTVPAPAARLASRQLGSRRAQRRVSHHISQSI